VTNNLMGKTAEKLREHGVEPTDSRTENLRLHLRWHRHPEPIHWTPLDSPETR
jgi:hypothetical protein